MLGCFVLITLQRMVLWRMHVLREEGLKFYDCCTDKWIHGPFLARDQEKNARSGAVAFSIHPQKPI